MAAFTNKWRVIRVVLITIVVAVFSAILVNCNGVNFSSNGNNIEQVDGLPNTPTDFSQSNCTLSYPYNSSNPTTDVAFNESRILAAFSAESDIDPQLGLTINVWYGDEKSMTLGVSSITVIDSSGHSTTTPYPLSALPSNPGSQASPQAGATAISGNQAGVDVNNCSGVPDGCSRPLYPALFITDITADSTSTSGDWQFGGTPIPPSEVNGTWKGATRTLDYTQNPVAVTVAVNNDPVSNDWNLGPNIPVPQNPQSEAGYGTVVSWAVNSLGLQSGHSYRIQFMIHDGDQNKAGGDAGEACVNLSVP